MVYKHISLTEEQANWLQTKIDNGNYSDESELFRDLIIKEQARDAEIESIRAALIEGEKSGISKRTPQEIFAAAKERLTKDGTI